MMALVEALGCSLMRSRCLRASAINGLSADLTASRQVSRCRCREFLNSPSSSFATATGVLSCISRRTHHALPELGWALVSPAVDADRRRVRGTGRVAWTRVGADGVAASAAHPTSPAPRRSFSSKVCVATRHRVSIGVLFARRN